MATSPTVLDLGVRTSISNIISGGGGSAQRKSTGDGSTRGRNFDDHGANADADGVKEGLDDGDAAPPEQFAKQGQLSTHLNQLGSDGGNITKSVADITGCSRLAMLSSASLANITSATAVGVALRGSEKRRPDSSLAGGDSRNLQRDTLALDDEFMAMMERSRTTDLVDRGETEGEAHAAVWTPLSGIECNLVDGDQAANALSASPSVSPIYVGSDDDSVQGCPADSNLALHQLGCTLPPSTGDRGSPTCPASDFGGASETDEVLMSPPLAPVVTASSTVAAVRSIGSGDRNNLTGVGSSGGDRGAVSTAAVTFGGPDAKVHAVAAFGGDIDLAELDRILAEEYAADADDTRPVGTGLIQSPAATPQLFRANERQSLDKFGSDDDAEMSGVVDNVEDAVTDGEDDGGSEVELDMALLNMISLNRGAREQEEKARAVKLKNEYDARKREEAADYEQMMVEVRAQQAHDEEVREAQRNAIHIVASKRMEEELVFGSFKFQANL
jgi:hypothetical protein